jgi:hypothetical protein
MKILFIAEKLHYRDWTGKTYSDLLLHFKLHSNHDVTIIYTDQKINMTTFEMPNIIVFFDTATLIFGNKYKQLFDLNIPIFASSLDLFNVIICVNCNYIKKCSGILHFGYASKLLSSYKDYFPNKIIRSFKGRFINKERFKNYNQEKIYDILIYGTRKYINSIELLNNADKEYKQKWELHYQTQLPDKWSFYPIREKVEQLLINNPNKYRVHIVPHACIFDAKIANEKLSQLINQSWLTLACSTRSDMPMAKYFEISGSYSGILGDIPSDYNDLFKDNIVEINEWMTDEEILNTIDVALENKQKLQEMINKLGNKIQLEYDLDAGVKDMDMIFDEIIN